MTRLTFRAADASTWHDLERLFEARGGPGHCWCMVWRRTPEESHDARPASRKRMLHARVEAGVPVGILAYRGGEPVGWCSVAPRETLRGTAGAPAAAPGDRVWSIVCFFVPRALRGGGMTRRLIGAAVKHARAQGASVVEAYPVDPDSPSYRFMGFVSTFRDLGFVEVGRAGTRRHVMRLAHPRR
ncbi:MAG: GNAT family N-acetyltransferase [Dehalococcoidia bacterium]